MRQETIHTYTAIRKHCMDKTGRGQACIENKRKRESERVTEKTGGRERKRTRDLKTRHTFVRKRRNRERWGEADMLRQTHAVPSAPTPQIASLVLG